MTTLYEELDVPLNATKDEIRKAYRHKAQQMHPDKGGDAAAFQKLQAAYDVLSDNERRAQYDRDGTCTPKPALRDQAMGEFAALMPLVISKFDFEHTDLVQLMRNEIQIKLRQIDQITATKKKELKRNAEIIKRLTAKDGNNILVQMVEAQNAGIQQECDAMNAAKAVFDEMVRILKNYQYRTDPQLKKPFGNDMDAMFSSVFATPFSGSPFGNKPFKFDGV